MKKLKVTICYLLLVFLFIYGSSAGNDEKRLAKSNKQQKHFLTLKANTLYLSKSLNSKQKIRVPFQRIFTISTSLHSNLSKKLITFSPTSIKLSQKKHSKHIQLQPKQKTNNQQYEIQGLPIIKNQGNFSLIDDLRTPFPVQMSQIVVVNEKFIFVFVFPNKIIVLQELENLILIKNTYFINVNSIKNQGRKQLTAQSFSFYAIGQQYVLGYIEQTNQFLMFNEQNYSVLKNEAKISNLEHVHSIPNSLQFFTAQRQGGFKHCQINLKQEKIDKIAQFSTFDSIGFKITKMDITTKNNLNIYDISFDYENSQVYLLDNNIGVIKFIYNLSKPQYNKQNDSYVSSLLIEQRGCQALDYIKNDRFVLICQDRRRRFFVEAYFSKTTNNFIKESPVFHNCYFDDLQITPQFYVAFEQTSVDIFWPSKRNFIPQLVHNKKHINLLGMQTFKIKADKNGDIFLYSIRNNILVKQKISEQHYDLKIGSQFPIIKSFHISVFGNCQSLFFKLNDVSKRYTMALHQQQVNKLNNYIQSKQIQNDSSQLLCQIVVPIEFQSSEYIIENRAKFAFAAGIFVICLLIAFSLICICFQKYKGMERKARQTLRKLESERKSNPQFVL